MATYLFIYLCQYIYSTCVYVLYVFIICCFEHKRFQFNCHSKSLDKSVYVKNMCVHMCIYALQIVIYKINLQTTILWYYGSNSRFTMPTINMQNVIVQFVQSKF